MKIDLSVERQIGALETIKKKKGKYIEVVYRLFRDRISKLIKEVNNG